MTMIINEKLTSLVTTLVEKTEEGKVSWNPTVNADEFVAGFSRYAILIRKDVAVYEFGDTSQETHLELLFLNEDGRVMDSKAASPDSLSGQSDDFERLYELFTLARRSAYNVEEGIDRLLQELESR